MWHRLDGHARPKLGHPPGGRERAETAAGGKFQSILLAMGALQFRRSLALLPQQRRWRRPCLESAGRHRRRSEEHTSEIQSLMRISYAVFCLKKKTIYNIQQ